MAHEEEMKQLSDLYELGLAWVGALETESEELDGELRRLRGVENSFLKARAKMTEISRIFDNGSENAG